MVEPKVPAQLHGTYRVRCECQCTRSKAGFTELRRRPGWPGAWPRRGEENHRDAGPD